ncbi:zinc ribbon domain-containing protein [Nocardioides sambongensis]|uniref:zinc ribbon domain-containing protein n=1 Tax=Nocardioides sambongensis TaxID=2589074 RepID=UPI0015E834F8|nr:zinc ribbon domain-containing protein [Nocardioides sambongensis]
MTQRFCGQCGSPVDHRFCGECGSPTGLDSDPSPAGRRIRGAEPSGPAEPVPTADADPTAVLPAVDPPTAPPTAQSPTPSTPATAPPAPAPPAAPVPVQGGVARTVRDAVLDVVAGLTLFVSLALPWNLDAGRVEEANEHWWVVLAVLLACAGLVVPYLGVLRVPWITPALSLLLKAAAVVPLALSVFFVLLFEIIDVAEPLQSGIGTGVVGAVLGMVLVLLPRRYDDFPALHPLGRRITTLLYLAAAALLVLTFVAEFVRFAVEDGFDQFLPGWYVVLGLLASALATLVLPAVPALLAARRPTVWTPVAATVIGCYLFVALAGSGDGDLDPTTGAFDRSAFLSVAVEKLSHAFDGWFVPFPVASGTFLLAAAVGFALGPWGRVPDTDRVEADRWLRTVVGAARLSAGLLVASVLLNLVAVVLAGISDDVDLDLSGTWIATMVMLAVAAGLAVAVALAAGAARTTLRTAVGLTLGWLFAGIVVTVLASTTEVGVGGGVVLTSMTVLETFAVLGAPLLVAGALTIPRGVRRSYEPLIPPQLLAAQPGQPTQPAGPADSGPLSPPPPPPSGPPPQARPLGSAAVGSAALQSAGVATAGRPSSRLRADRGRFRRGARRGIDWPPWLTLRRPRPTPPAPPSTPSPLPGPTRTASSPGPSSA